MYINVKIKMFFAQTCFLSIAYGNVIIDKSWSMLNVDGNLAMMLINIWNVFFAKTLTFQWHVCKNAIIDNSYFHSIQSEHWKKYIVIQNRILGTTTWDHKITYENYKRVNKNIGSFVIHFSHTKGVYANFSCQYYSIKYTLYVYLDGFSSTYTVFPTIRPSGLNFYFFGIAGIISK